MEQLETILIKGMVCHRCIITLKERIESMGVNLESIELGKIRIYKNTELPYSKLYAAISSLGFEILKEKQVKLVENIKSHVEYYLSTSENKLKFSEFLSDKLNMNYDQLSGIFSEREGITLEHYIIHQKIEKVKRQLSDTEITVTEISFRNNYSSVHHLSHQFKEITGLNPSQYREVSHQKKI